ncbi:uncharacterized protein IWZ02DRAFT_480030 [Phyllosticta citriasiana]
MVDHFGQYGMNWLRESLAIQPQFQNGSAFTQNFLHNTSSQHVQAAQASDSHGAQSPAVSDMDWTPTYSQPARAPAIHPTNLYPQHTGTLNYQPSLKLPAGHKKNSSHMPARCVTDLRRTTLSYERLPYGRPSKEARKLLNANREEQRKIPITSDARIQSTLRPRETHANFKKLHVGRKSDRPKLPLDSTQPYCPIPPATTTPRIEHYASFAQAPATPLKLSSHPQIRRVLNPQDATAKYVYHCTTRMNTPQLARAVPGGFPTTPVKRSFDEYAADKEPKSHLASGLPVTGREDYVEPCRPGTNAPHGIIRACSTWLLQRSRALLSGFIPDSFIYNVASNFEKARSLLSRSPQDSYDHPTFNVTSKSHKRHITMPGAFPESPAMFNDIPSVEQTESVSNSVPAAHTQSQELSQLADQLTASVPISEQAGKTSQSPAPQRVIMTRQLSTEKPIPRKEKLVNRMARNSFGLSEMRQRKLAYSARTGWQQSAKLDTGDWPRIGHKQKEERLLGSSLSSSIGASSITSASPRHGLIPHAAIKAPEENLFRSSVLLSQMPSSGQYAESESRPTSSGSDSSVIVDPSDATKEVATTLESVTISTDGDYNSIVGELQRSVQSQSDKLAAEEARRRQQLEEKAREEKRVLQERQAREKADREAREAAAAAAEAARVAETKAALEAMTEHERWVFESSNGLFGALPHSHANTLQELAQKADAYDIKGNFKSKDLRSMIGPNPSRAIDRPWLNDEAVCKATDMLCVRANEKAGFSKQMKAKGRPAPFHAYTPMWFTSINSFGEGSMKSWGRRANHLGDNLFHTQAVFLPICDKSHWRLVVIFGQKRTIHYFDSLGGPSRHYVNIAKRLMSVFMGEHWSESDWTVVQEQTSPRQGNGSDCGMFVIVNTANILRGRAVMPSSYDSQPDVIDHARRWFASAIVNGGFTGYFDWHDDVSPVTF